MQTTPSLMSMTLVIVTMKLCSVLLMPQTVVVIVMEIEESGIYQNLMECQPMVVLTCTLAETEVAVCYVLY